MDTNFVLAGKYEGGVIKTDKNNKVYVEHTTKTASGYSFDSKWYFDKTNVTSIEKINEESSSFKTSASYWLGSVAAAGLSDVKDVILQITWRDNTESIIKVREGIYTQILATRISIVESPHILTDDELTQARTNAASEDYLIKNSNLIEEKYCYASSLIHNAKSKNDILEAASVYAEIIEFERQADFSKHLLQSTALSAQKIEFISTIFTVCASFLEKYGEKNDPANAERYFKYKSVQTSDYTVEKVIEKLKVYEELGDYQDCKKVLATVGDYNNPNNLTRYIDYLRNVNIYCSPQTKEDFENARVFLENMGDYLDASTYADQQASKEYADSYFKLHPPTIELDFQATQQSPSSVKKEGCYVATCVYGSYDCPQVWALRRFRDNTLGSTWYGRAFIRTYYAISPTLVKWFGKNTWFKKMWKGTLDRMVKKLEENGVANTPYEDKNW